MLLAASCVFRRGPDPTRFYVLAASVPDSPHGPRSLAIGLGPIVMPGYLDHPGLATRVGAEVRYAETDRWAEPLRILFARALGRDLSTLLGARIVPYPWYRSAPVDVVVRVDVASFELDGAGDAELVACWTIRDARTGTVRRDDCSSIEETIGGSLMEDRVAALGRAVAELARRVAAAIGS